MFPGWTQAPGCTQRRISNAGFIEGWYCSARTADGSYEVILLSRWSSAAAGERFLLSQVSRSLTRGAWSANGVRYGNYVQGVKGTDTAYTARVYTHGASNPWTFEAYSNSWEKTSRLFRYIQARNPFHFRGVPLN